MQAPGVALAPSTAARGQQTEAEPGIQVQVPASGVVALPTAAELAPVVVWRRRRLEAAATLQAAARAWLAQQLLQQLRCAAAARHALQHSKVRRALACWHRAACAATRLRGRLHASPSSSAGGKSTHTGPQCEGQDVGGSAAAAARLRQRCGVCRTHLPGLPALLAEHGKGGLAAEYRRRKLLMKALWAWVAQAASREGLAAA